MPVAKLKEFRMDRRSLLKMTGTMGIGGNLHQSRKHCFAKDQCEYIVIDNGEVNARQSGKVLQFWIDGMHLVGENEKQKKLQPSQRSPHAATFTLFIDQQQSPNSYVEISCVNGRK